MEELLRELSTCSKTYRPVHHRSTGLKKAVRQAKAHSKLPKSMLSSASRTSEGGESTTKATDGESIHSSEYRAYRSPRILREEKEWVPKNSGRLSALNAVTIKAECPYLEATTYWIDWQKLAGSLQTCKLATSK